MKLWQKKDQFTLKLWHKIMMGLVLGVIAGIILGPKVKYLKPIGDLFINAIKMLVVPLVFTSLITGVTSINDPKKMGRVGIKTIAFLLCTTSIAVCMGFFFSSKIIKPGIGMHLTATNTQEVRHVTSLSETFVNIIPSNPIGAMAKGDLLQTVVFAILLGIAISLVGKKVQPLAQMMEFGAEAMYKLTAIVMEAAPYGIFALIAWVCGTYGLKTLIPLIKVIGCVYAGCLTHGILTYSLILLIIGLNPFKFYRAIADTITMGFATSSSSGTLPVTIRCANENLGVPKHIANFVLPLGATIDMNGTALYQGVCAVFISQAYGIPLQPFHYVIIVLTSVLAAIGTAGVPSSGLIMLSMVLSAVGLPLEGVGLIAGIDRILDMARTALNVTGESLVALLVARSEGELDTKIYNAN